MAALATTIGLIAPADAVEADGKHRSRAKVLAEDLSSPKGLAVGARHNLIITQGAFGASGPVLSYQLHGPGRGSLTPITADAFNIIDVAVNPHDGTAWVIGADQNLYFVEADRVTIRFARNIPEYQATDLDPVDQDDPPFPEESNPYGLAIDHNGDALLADAAGNDLLRITPANEISTVARFDLELVTTAHLGDPTLPPEMTAEAVPTTVAVGKDGSIYVGELKGFPFQPGSSRIWKIDPEADGAWCSVDEPDPTWDCHRYSRGYTAIQDIAIGRHGKLYVYELAAEGVLAFEAGFETGVFPPAVLLEVSHPWKRGKHRRELAKGELSEPGGIVVHHGHVYVTDGVFTGGRLLKIGT